jgi:hypothetical protein
MVLIKEMGKEIVNNVEVRGKEKVKGTAGMRNILLSLKN